MDVTCQQFMDRLRAYVEARSRRRFFRLCALGGFICLFVAVFAQAEDKGLKIPKPFAVPVSPTPRFELVPVGEAEKSTLAASPTVATAVRPMDASVITHFSGLDARGKKKLFNGSGTAVSCDGVRTLILTVAHLATDPPVGFYTVLYNNKKYAAILVSSDQKKDVAILAVDTVIPTVGINERLPSVGESLVSVGASGGVFVEQSHKFVDSDGTFLFATSRVLDGKSGGGLFDADGRLCGVVKGRVLEKDQSSFVKSSVAASLLPVRYEAYGQSASPRRLVKAYSLKSCRNCKAYHDKFGDGDSRVAINWTDETLPDWIRRKLPRGYEAPVFVWTNGSKSQWPQSSLGVTLDQLSEWADALDADREMPPVACASVGFAGQEFLTEWLQTVQGWAGPKAKATIRLVRNGGLDAILVKGTHTKQDVFGKSGRFEFVLTDGGDSLPIHEIKFGYRFETKDGKERFYVDQDEVEIEIPETNVFASSEPKQAYGCPLVFVAYQVISWGYTIYEILHPTIDIYLGNEITASATLEDGSLNVQFEKAPSVRAHWSFMWGLLKTEYSRPLTGVVLGRDGNQVQFHKSQLFRDVDIPGL